MASMGRAGELGLTYLGSGPLRPFGAMMPVKQTNDVYDKLATNWKIDPGADYLGTFLKKYNDIYGKMSAGVQGQGGAGLGQFDPGNAGMGTFTTSSYISPLLDSMKARIASEYNTPKTSMGYLTSMDQIAAQEEGARQNLANQFGGNQRGSGVYAAAQAALARDLARNKATASRETEMQARDMANKNAFGLEGMLQGQFNTEQGARQAAYEAARQGELANMGLKSSAFESARNRELDNARLNSQFSLDSNSALAGLLNPLSGMLQWDAARGPAAQQQSWNNLKDLYGYKAQQLAADKNYATDLYNAQKQNYEEGDAYNRQADKWQWGQGTWAGNPFGQKSTAGTSGGYGSPFGRGFKGGYAEGGKLKTGEWAIVGEQGPEILDATGENVEVIPLDDKPNIMRQIVGRLLMASPAGQMAGMQRAEPAGRMAGMLGSGQMAQMTDTPGGNLAQRMKGGPVAGARPYRMGGSYDATTALSPMALAAWRKFRGGMAKGGTLNRGTDGTGLDLQDMAWQQRLKDRDKELALAALMDKLNNGTMVDNSTGQTPVAAYDVPQELQGQYGAKYLTNRMMPEKAFTPQGPDMMWDSSAPGATGANIPGGSLTDQGNIDWSSLADESTPMYAQSEGFREPQMVKGSQGDNMAAIQNALLGGIIDKGTADTMMKPMEMAEQAANRKAMQEDRLAANKALQEDRQAHQEGMKSEVYRQKQADDMAKIDSMSTNLDRLAENAKALKAHPGLAGITGIRGAIMDIPGTDAANARAALNSLKSEAGMDTLVALKAGSGAGLGQVTEAEHKLLQNYLTSLAESQSKEQFEKSLDKLIAFSEKAKGKITKAYENKWQGKGGAAPQAPAQAGRFTIREIQ